jgi:hypothetical protein
VFSIDTDRLLAVAARDDLQEANLHVDLRRRALDDALEPDGGTVAARDGIAAGVDAPERPALLVLHRRQPVREQHVSLVENGVGDLAYDVGHPASPSSRSIALSHESSACRDL